VFNGSKGGRALAMFQTRSSLKDTIIHTLTYVTEENKGTEIKYLIKDYGDVRGRRQGARSTIYGEIISGVLQNKV
jgi:hypothetical protein